MNEEKFQFFDINKFPSLPGLLIFGISMSKITNSQSAEKCFEYIEHLVNKISKPDVGLQIIYSDYLYLNSDQKASELKDKYLSQMLTHKNHFLKILSKNQWYIEKSFSFSTWGQIILQIKERSTYLGSIRELYQHDTRFQNCIAQDAKNYEVKLDQNQLNFFLEEILFFYLLAKGKIPFENKYVGGHEQWILQCYPGEPLNAEIYLFQKNPLSLHNPNNKYESSFYDLLNKKLYDYTKVDLS